jgi:hypothetical protein
LSKYFAGGHNFHGKYEYVPVESMQKAVDVIVKIAELTAIGLDQRKPERKNKIVLLKKIREVYKKNFKL